jgi:hypothetical protein
MNSSATDRDRLHSLHELVTSSLLDHLSKKPTAELLQVARRFLRDNAMVGVVVSLSEQKLMRTLYRLYVRKLKAALEVANPPAAVLAEVLRFLQMQGVTKDLSASVSHSQALHALGSAALPFKTH